MQVSLTKRLIRSSNGNYHAYPFCITMPGTVSLSHVSVKLAKIGCKTILSVKVRVHHKNSTLVWLDLISPNAKPTHIYIYRDCVQIFINIIMPKKLLTETSYSALKSVVPFKKLCKLCTNGPLRLLIYHQRAVHKR